MPAKAPRPGDTMPDGSIYAGLSPETLEPLYVTPADARLAMSFNGAADYAAKLDAHGHRDWRVPTKAELGVLFNNRAAIGGFKTSPPGRGAGAVYWSSSPDANCTWLAKGLGFGDGSGDRSDKETHAWVRCVRSANTQGRDKPHCKP
jgi:hypothetical protein